MISKIGAISQNRINNPIQSNPIRQNYAGKQGFGFFMPRTKNVRVLLMNTGVDNFQSTKFKKFFNSADIQRDVEAKEAEIKRFKFTKTDSEDEVDLVFDTDDLVKNSKIK